MLLQLAAYGIRSFISLCVDQTIHRKGINLTTNLGENVWKTSLCTMLNTLAWYRYATNVQITGGSYIHFKLCFQSV